MMKRYQSNKDRIHAIADKMGLKFVDSEGSSIQNSKMLNISKPGRPYVKESIQKQLDILAGKRINE